MEIPISHGNLQINNYRGKFRSHSNRIILSRSHPKSYHANIKIFVISRYNGNCYHENIKLPITLLLLHTSITHFLVLRNACLGAVNWFRVAHERSLWVNNNRRVFFFFLFSLLLLFFFPFFPPVAHLVRKLLTRLDVSANPGTWDFFFSHTKKINKNK